MTIAPSTSSTPIRRRAGRLARSAATLHRRADVERVVRRPQGARPRLARDAGPRRHRAHRPVGLRQVDVPPHPQPHARARARRVAGRHGRPRRRSTSTASDAAATEIRRRIGMVFQKPNPFPAMTIAENVLAGLKLCGLKRRARATTARSSRSACAGPGCGTRSRTGSATPGGALSGGQQQRLCIARALAVRPEVLLMDEPCSALDPTSTRRIEETIAELRDEVTIVIVTHNMQQAQRVSQHCAFFLAAENEPGHIVEAGPDREDVLRPRRPPHARLRARAVRMTCERIRCVAPRRSLVRSARRSRRRRRCAGAPAARADGRSTAPARRGRRSRSTSGAPTSRARASRSTTRASARPPGRVFYYQDQVDFAVSEIPFQPDVPRPRRAPSSTDEIELAAHRPVRVPADRRRRHVVHVPPRRQRASGSRTCACRRRRRQDLHRRDQELERPRDHRRQPGGRAPEPAIRPVVRSDGSGTTAQFTAFMASQTPGDLERVLSKRRVST